MNELKGKGGNVESCKEWEKWVCVYVLSCSCLWLYVCRRKVPVTSATSALWFSTEWASSEMRLGTPSRRSPKTSWKCWTARAQQRLVLRHTHTHCRRCLLVLQAYLGSIFVHCLSLMKCYALNADLSLIDPSDPQIIQYSLKNSTNSKKYKPKCSHLR